MSPSPPGLAVREAPWLSHICSSTVHVLAAVRTWATGARPVLERAKRPPFEPPDGGALLHRLLRRLRDAGEPRRADPARKR